MDSYENGLSKEFNLDSWDIINDVEDSQDFEIVKVVEEIVTPFIEAESYPLLPSDESFDAIILNNQDKHNALPKDIFTTDDSGETTDEDYEDIKKCKQGIKRELDRINFVETHIGKLSTKKEPKLRRKPEKTITKIKEEIKNKMKKCNIKKSRPLLNSANLGALLTAFGLSLIFLHTSDKTQTCPSEQEMKNVSDSLIEAINSSNIWSGRSTNIFDEENLIERFLPSHVNKTLLEKKNIKTKILKRIDRKIKQQIRGCDIKPLKKPKTITTCKPRMIGPLNDDDEFYTTNNNSSTESSKPISYRDALLMKNVDSSNSSRTSGTIDSNVSKTKAEMIHKFLNKDVKNFTPIPHETKPDKTLSVLKKKPNCSSIYRDFIKAEMLFKKMMNNSYDIPKPKTPTDLAYNIENKINILTVDNINLSNIIEEQENLLRQIQKKIEYKKDILQKRSQQKNILQKRLKFAKWMKQKREEHEETTKLYLGEPIQTKTNTSKSSTEIAPYEMKFPFKNKSEEETALYLKQKLYYLKKHEDLQRTMETKKRKLMDEEHMKANKLPEKSDPKRAWTKKKTEF